VRAGRDVLFRVTAGLTPCGRSEFISFHGAAAEEYHSLFDDTPSIRSRTDWFVERQLALINQGLSKERAFEDTLKEMNANTAAARANRDLARQQVRSVWERVWVMVVRVHTYSTTEALQATSGTPALVTALRNSLVGQASAAIGASAAQAAPREPEARTKSLPDLLSLLEKRRTMASAFGGFGKAAAVMTPASTAPTSTTPAASPVAQPADAQGSGSKP
jgi:hypothetical protein